MKITVDTAPACTVAASHVRAYVVFDPHELFEGAYSPSNPETRLVLVADESAAEDDARVATLARELADAVQDRDTQASEALNYARKLADREGALNEAHRELTLSRREIHFLYDELAKLARRTGNCPEELARHQIKARLEALAARRNVEGRQYEGPSGGNW